MEINDFTVRTVLHESGVQYKLVAEFVDELYKVVNSAPMQHHKEKYIHEYLDKALSNTDFADSFST